MCVIDLQLHETIFTLLTANGHQTKRKYSSMSKRYNDWVSLYIRWRMGGMGGVVIGMGVWCIHFSFFFRYLLRILHGLAFNHITSKNTEWKKIKKKPTRKTQGGNKERKTWIQIDSICTCHHFGHTKEFFFITKLRSSFQMERNQPIHRILLFLLLVVFCRRNKSTHIQFTWIY